MVYCCQFKRLLLFADDSISCLRFSPGTIQSTFLLAGSWDNNVRCWEITNTGQSVPKAQQSMQVGYSSGKFQLEIHFELCKLQILQNTDYVYSLFSLHTFWCSCSHSRIVWYFLFSFEPFAASRWCQTNFKWIKNVCVLGTYSWCMLAWDRHQGLYGFVWQTSQDVGSRVQSDHPSSCTRRSNQSLPMGQGVKLRSKFNKNQIKNNCTRRPLLLGRGPIVTKLD